MKYEKGKLLISRVVVALLLLMVAMPSHTASVVAAPDDWTEPATNPIVDPDVALEVWDGYSVVSIGAASVIWDESAVEYKMWYTGVDNSTDGVLKIGYATSDDGTSWEQYAGNPVLSPAGSSWEEASVGTPCVIKVDTNSYLMWYTASDDADISSIGYATSTNGTTWGTRVEVTGLGEQAWEAGGVSSPSVLKDGNDYRMWYSGKQVTEDLLGEQAIGYATSNNGVDWTPSGDNPVLIKDGEDWESDGIAVANVIRLGSARYKMWYTGYGVVGGDYVSKLGYATSANGTTWERSPKNPVLSNSGTEAEWDEVGIGAPSLYSVYGDGIIYKMWYSGISSSELTIKAGYAEMSMDISGRCFLQGGERPTAGQVVPLTLKLFAEGANVWSATPVRSYNVTSIDTGYTGTSKKVYFEIEADVPPGTYDVTLASPHTLMNIKRGFDMTSLPVSINMGTLLEGNCNDDFQINAMDFSAMVPTYGKSSIEAGFKPVADFDNSGMVNAFDFSLMVPNYGKYSPITV